MRFLLPLTELHVPSILDVSTLTTAHKNFLVISCFHYFRKLAVLKLRLPGYVRLGKSLSHKQDPREGHSKNINCNAVLTVLQLYFKRRNWTCKKKDYTRRLRRLNKRLVTKIINHNGDKDNDYHVVITMMQIIIVLTAKCLLHSSAFLLDANSALSHQFQLSITNHPCVIRTCYFSTLAQTQRNTTESLNRAHWVSSRNNFDARSTRIQEFDPASRHPG